MPEIDFRGVNAHYRTWGRGTALLFLHSGGSSSRQWEKTAAILADRHSIVAPDLLGFGGSGSWPESGTLTHDLQANLAAQVLANITERPVDVIGHSYGGATAIRLALEHPGRVRSLVLIEPILHHLLQEIGDPLFAGSIVVGNSFIESVDAGRPEAGWQTFLDTSNGPGTWDRLSDVQRQRFLTQSAQTKEAFISNFNNRTSAADCRSIKVPATVVHGTRTLPVYRRMAELLLGALTYGHGARIEGAEHMSPLTHPAEVAQAVSNHIERCHFLDQV